ncbi:MAG: bifunctional sugar-1-phosphate nucleotidylyltransferase/acetyltransferase [Halobacteriota archaeon]
MLAVILAAGEGTRMRPLTYNRPKVMLPVVGKPILEHIIHSCVNAGVTRVLVVTGYHEDTIRSYFNNRALGAEIEFIRQERQLGTADAINQARDSVHERFLVLNGDSLVSPSTLKHLIKRARAQSTVIAATKVSDPSNYGILEVSGKTVSRIIEKPKNPHSDLANIGIYVFDPMIFEAIDKTTRSARGEYEITDAIQLLIEWKDEVGYLRIDEPWIDVGRPWDLLRANELLLPSVDEVKNEGLVEPFATVDGAVKVGRGSIIRNGAYVTGPAIIGVQCDIGPNCYIRPGTCLGDRVKIGNAVEVKNSIIMDDCKIGHLSYVGDSIIGERCNFGAGTLVANLRFDERPIKVGGASTGRRKLGVIMGDDVHTGINSMINVGSSIGPRSILDIGAVANGVYSPGSRIKLSRER